MKLSVHLALLAILLVALYGYTQSSSTNSDNGVFSTKALELTKEKTDRIDKLQAIHTFVRDSIGQAKTQYG